MRVMCILYGERKGWVKPKMAPQVIVLELYSSQFKVFYFTVIIAAILGSLIVLWFVAYKRM